MSGGCSTPFDSTFDEDESNDASQSSQDALNRLANAPIPDLPLPSLPGAQTSAAAEESLAVRVGDYTLTDTVAGHLGERIGGVGDYGGSLSRPYLQSPSTINEIIATGKGVPDPGGLSRALRYDVPGVFRGSAGNWELVVDPNTQTIYHFNFKTGR
jgi:hypothetical protein